MERRMTDDLISRQAVLDMAYAYGNGLEPEGYCVDVEDIQALPSAQPERKKGKWIIGKYRLTCGQCRFTYPNKLMDEMGVVNFCPNCGARMKGESDG